MKRLAITIGCALIAALPVASAFGKDPKLKTAISGAIPVIQEHLNMAKADATKLGN